MCEIRSVTIFGKFYFFICLKIIMLHHHFEPDATGNSGQGPPRLLAEVNIKDSLKIVVFKRISSGVIWDKIYRSRDFQSSGSKMVLVGVVLRGWL